jgi:hypothetical protein
MTRGRVEENNQGGRSVMGWVVVAVIAAGALIGFVTGGARVSSAGHVTTGVTGFVAGVFATKPTSQEVQTYAMLFCLYIASLFGMYVLANVLRHKKKLRWLYGASHAE